MEADTLMHSSVHVTSETVGQKVFIFKICLFAIVRQDPSSIRIAAVHGSKSSYT